MIRELNIWQALQQLDRWLFEKINGHWTNSFLDYVFILLRQANFWMPLYLFLFVFVAVNFKRNWWWWIILFVCTVAITDMVGTHVFKNVFKRLRPCRDPFFAPYVHLVLKECSGSYSFISNHAANHFGLATFIYFTLRPYVRGGLWLAWAWAITISYAQIYVGIHYPLDVICGALVGILFGLFTATFFNKKFGFANFDTQPTIPY